MTKEQIYHLYLNANPTSTPVPQDSLFSFPMLNFDIYEDEQIVINRLFYALPLPETSSLFLFFEDNSFSKDSCGELDFLRSSLEVWQPNP